jgi:prepilin-type N-terminal cleavage/methylation domain-containing protein
METEIFASLRVNSNKAFTLIELLIVVLIIGLVLGLFIVNFSFSKKEKLAGFSELKPYLQKLAEVKTSTLRCYGELCESCYLYSEDNRLLKSGLDIFTKKPKTYDYDQYGYLSEIQYPNEQCFEYKLYANGSSSTFLVEKDELFYLFPSVLDRAIIFEDYDKAVKEIDPNLYLPQDMGEYYNER